MALKTRVSVRDREKRRVKRQGQVRREWERRVRKKWEVSEKRWIKWIWVFLKFKKDTPSSKTFFIYQQTVASFLAFLLYSSFAFLNILAFFIASLSFYFSIQINTFHSNFILIFFNYLFDQTSQKKIWSSQVN